MYCFKFSRHRQNSNIWQIETVIKVLYFIGYKDEDIIRPLCIVLPQMINEWIHKLFW